MTGHIPKISALPTVRLLEPRHSRHHRRATAAPQAVRREKDQCALFEASTLALGRSHESPEVYMHTGHVAWYLMSS
jgi:hypothetical protein